MKIDAILYQTAKDKKLADFDEGKIASSVAGDLLKAGIKDANRFVFGASKATAQVKKVKEDVKKAEGAKKTAKPAQGYALVGVSGKDLVCQIKDNSDSKFENNTVMLKDYVAERTKLASAKDAVLDVHDTDDKTVMDATKNLAAARGVKSQVAVQAGDADLGDITGDVVMCAHGADSKIGGRVIGVELGGKSAAQIVDLITASKDKSKRIPKSFSKKLILVGCFTASGGPAALANEADQPFAAKCRTELGNRGYKNVAVVGMPGPARVTPKAPPNTQYVDQHGTPMKEGDTSTEHSADHSAELAAIQKRIDGNMEKLNQGAGQLEGSGSGFRQ